MALFHYGSHEATVENTIVNKAEFERRMIAVEAGELRGEALATFCEAGGLGMQLVAEGKMSRNTLVRLSKRDDLARRTKSICYQLAREAHDPNMAKFDKYRALALQAERKVEAKYGIKAAMLARKQQAEYLKGGRDGEKKGLLAAFGAKDR